jgi:hypothetical protein
MWNLTNFSIPRLSLQILPPISVCVCGGARACVCGGAFAMVRVRWCACGGACVCAVRKEAIDALRGDVGLSERKGSQAREGLVALILSGTLDPRQQRFQQGIRERNKRYVQCLSCACVRVRVRACVREQRSQRRRVVGSIEPRARHTRVQALRCTCRRVASICGRPAIYTTFSSIYIQLYK